MTDIQPMLAVPDVTVAAEYYRDVLGFTIRLFWGEPPTYAIVDRGSVSVNFIVSESVSGDEGDKGGAYIIVNDVDAVYAELKEHGANLWGEPVDQEYGMRDFIAIDLNGYRLCFGENVE